MILFCDSIRKQARTSFNLIIRKGDYKIKATIEANAYTSRYWILTEFFKKVLQSNFYQKYLAAFRLLFNR